VGADERVAALRRTCFDAAALTRVLFGAVASRLEPVGIALDGDDPGIVRQRVAAPFQYRVFRLPLSGTRSGPPQAWELDGADEAEKLIRNPVRRLEPDAPGVRGSRLEGQDIILTVNRLGLLAEPRHSRGRSNIVETINGTVRRVFRDVRHGAAPRSPCAGLPGAGVRSYPGGNFSDTGRWRPHPKGGKRPEGLGDIRFLRGPASQHRGDRDQRKTRERIPLARRAPVIRHQRQCAPKAAGLRGV